jgi:hypothetical protein
MKIPLKTKKIGWYLRRGVILTKNNLVKWNWKGNTQCVFCHQDETINHLFFNCRFARTIWSLIQVASSLYPPTSVANIFGNWLYGIDLRFRRLIRVGALAIIWSLWLCRNDKVFNDKNYSLLQVIYRCTSILCLWSPLQRMEHHDLFVEVWHGWRLRRGIFFPYMGGRIIYGLVLHLHLRRSTIAHHLYVFCLFSFFVLPEIFELLCVS